MLFTVFVSPSKTAKNRQTCSALNFSFWYIENLPPSLEKTTCIRVSPYHTIVSAIFQILKQCWSFTLRIYRLTQKTQKYSFALTCRVLREKFCKFSCWKMIGDVFTWIRRSVFGPPVTRAQENWFFCQYITSRPKLTKTIISFLPANKFENCVEVSLINISFNDWSRLVD